MKEICLTQGYVALVDDEDYAWLGGYTWHAQKADNTYYAVNKNRGREKLYMHILILKYHNLYNPELYTDHKDKNGLNNTKENLRLATGTQNNANMSIRSDNTSGYKGVSFNKRNGMYQVELMYKGKHKFFGYYVDKHHAARIYNYYAKQYFGEFASLNDVPDDA